MMVAAKWLQQLSWLEVLVHNPRGPSGPTGESSGVSLLSLSQAVHCLVAGSLRPGAKEDVLLVGMATALLAYDVENNADLFFREVPDGANCITTGYLGTLRNPVVLVGGNCSIQGYDHEGKDVFWTVTGDNVRALALYDYLKDGLNEVDGRHVTTGEVVFRDAFPHGVAGIVQADYCGDGREELIVCSVNGEVRGYLPTTAELRQQIVDATFEQDTVRELSQKKQMLQLEMRNYEGQAKTASGTPKGTTDQRYGTISAATQLKTLLAINSGTADISPHVEVALKTNNETVIHAVMLFAEGIFSGESFVHHPKDDAVTSEASIPLFPTKDQAVDLHLKVFVGQKKSKHFHVFEVSRQLPKFAMYLLVDEARTKKPTGSVRFKLAERPQRGAPVKAGVWRVASPRTPSHAGSPAHVWLCVAFPCPGKRASWWLSRARVKVKENLSYADAKKRFSFLSKGGYAEVVRRVPAPRSETKATQVSPEILVADLRAPSPQQGQHAAPLGKDGPAIAVPALPFKTVTKGQQAPPPRGEGAPADSSGQDRPAPAAPVNTGRTPMEEKKRGPQPQSMERQPGTKELRGSHAASLSGNEVEQMDGVEPLPSTSTTLPPGSGRGRGSGPRGTDPPRPAGKFACGAQESTGTALSAPSSTPGSDQDEMEWQTTKKQKSKKPVTPPK
ncbi:hypothetical protein HPB47_018703 [Ixodes persulcatus]|uniref:Uncharacterized protein n=1 Tax=Ixodes persulcatus TaxID=34615 RepID=A0AC60QK15_IXOPE|nr:hypothetical protein HPB47_018703 [Ixodes persulcatus]